MLYKGWKQTFMHIMCGLLSKLGYRYLGFFKSAFLQLVGGLIYKAVRKAKIINTDKELYS